jgi:Fe2+ transport system protein B
MKSVKLTQQIQETLNLSEDPPESLIEGSPEFPQIKELLDGYFVTRDIHHRHDESRVHQMEMIVQEILKRESGHEYYETAEAAAKIVKDLIKRQDRDNTMQDVTKKVEKIVGVPIFVGRLFK